ncbi:Hypothetical protein A7982_01701 [Minicystis rosea]|nr:Hypothetical protein A7982_01701 [Minicystis rosea]
MADGPSLMRIGRTRGRIARWLRRLALASALSPIALGLVEVATHVFPDDQWRAVWSPVVTWGPLTGIVLMLLAALVYAMTSSWTTTGHVTIDDGRISARTRGGFPLARAERPASGIIVPHGSSARAELELSGGDTLHTSFTSIDEADRWLARLGLDPAKRAVVIAGAGPARTTLRALGAAVSSVLASATALGMWIQRFGRLPTWAILPWLIVTVMASFLAVRASRPATVRVGVDGLVIHRALRDVVVSFRDLESVLSTSSGLVIRLVSGERIHVRMPDAEAREAIVHRVEVARLRAGGGPALDGILAKAGRDVKAWRDHLRAWARGGSAFRSAPPSPDELESVLVDPGATDATRIGAALALKEIEGVGRVRIAVEAAANPKLRIALQHVASETEDDAALEEAVRAIEAEG